MGLLFLNALYTVYQKRFGFAITVEYQLISLIFFHNNNNTSMNFQQFDTSTAHRPYCVFLHYLGKEKLSNFHVFNNRHWLYFHIFLFSSATLRTCVNARGGRIFQALALSCLSCRVLSEFLILFFFTFLSFMLTM